MNNPCQSKESNEEKGNGLMLGDMLIVADVTEDCKFSEVGKQAWKIVGVDIVACHEPVGKQQSENGRSKGAETEGQNVGSKSNPKERYKIENFDEEDAGNANHSKGIEHGACSSAVLIGLEDDEIESNEA